MTTAGAEVPSATGLAQSTELEPPLPAVGELALDTATGRIGRVMATGDLPGARRKWWLRPAGGGLEWDVDREHVAPAPPDAEESS